MTEYMVLKPVRSDKKRRAWDVGDTVKDGDFPKYIIAQWLKRGILEEVDDGSDHKREG